MAFPSNPSDGQIYKNYKYNSTKGAWIYSPYIGYDEDGNVIIEPVIGRKIIFDDGVNESYGTLHKITKTRLVDNVDPTNSSHYTVIVSSVPNGTTAVYLNVMHDATSTGELATISVAGTDGSMEHRTQPNNSTGSSYTSFNYFSCIPLDSNKQFEWWAHHVAVSAVYIDLMGYWI